MYIDRRILYVILGIFVLTNAVGLLTDKMALLSLLLTLPAVLIAITFHEFAHAFAADKLGDDTPRRQGRLNLNPLSHLDPIGSIMLVFAGFGWGKPVEINPNNFNRDRSMSASEAIVAFAGPLMNFILAIVFTIVTGVVLVATDSYLNLTSLTIISSSEITGLILQLLLSCVSINLGLGIFNLIPLPPLDGSKVLRNFLPYNAKAWMDSNYHLLYIIFVVVWITPIASTIISPIIGGVFDGLLQMILGIFGRII